MFLKIVDTIAEWLGPVLVLLAVAAGLAARNGYTVPAAAGALPIAGLVFSVLGLLAAFEEKKRLNIIVLSAAIVVGAAWIAYTNFVPA